jgi:trehalose 6-phosphate synthase
VQDYQLQLLPAALRERRPDLRIGFFLHIPFPPTELFMQLPWRKRIIEGLLGADLVGFHTAGGARNFRALATRFTDATTERGALRYGRRMVRFGAFPISIDSKSLEALARTPEVQARAKAIRADLGDPEHLILGVDRLDYTKGIQVRLRAFEELLAEGRAEDTVMLQIATPSRERVEHYQRLRADVEQAVGRINGDYSSVGHSVLDYLHQSLPRDELVAFFVAADVMLVTPLRDGMNLVAKEYVASRADLGGVLVLSEFTGAAVELKDALLVNPHDIDGLKNAIRAAFDMPRGESSRRMRTLRRQVLTHDVDRWARSFLDALGLPDEDRPE